MPQVRVIGWKPGLQKVAMTKVFQRELSVGLKPVKDMTDRTLDGEVVVIEVDTPERAIAIAGQLAHLGADVEVIGDQLP